MASQQNAQKNSRSVLDQALARKLDAQSTQVRTPLFAWWSLHARALPWRGGKTTPWGVLVCEVMSQQTQMSRVVPYWEHWIEQWPDARSLSEASKAEVIQAWGRLGYPRRALRLQECAQVVAEKYGDKLPANYEELIALPGIGDYTASAVLSFAFGKRIAVVDTNIRRVLSRVFLGEESLGGAATPLERALANCVLPQQAHDATTWNQAVMELGALVCTAKQPLCDECPVRKECSFLAAGLPNLGERRTRPRQRFQGTDRQVRGLILHALRDLSTDSAQNNTHAKHSKTGVLSYKQACKLWGDRVQLDRCIASLDEDGLIEILPEHAMRLPQ